MYGLKVTSTENNSSSNGLIPSQPISRSKRLLIHVASGPAGLVLARPVFHSSKKNSLQASISALWHGRESSKCSRPTDHQFSMLSPVLVYTTRKLIFRG